jgi:hypothetical protein
MANQNTLMLFPEMGTAEFDFNTMLGDKSYHTVCGLPVKVDKILRDTTKTTVLGISGTMIVRGVILPWRVGLLRQYHGVSENAPTHLAALSALQHRLNLRQYNGINVPSRECEEADGRRCNMTTNDHIAAIKEHLKAIEAEKQPKKEPKRYLVVDLEYYPNLDGFPLSESIAMVLYFMEKAENGKAFSPTVYRKVLSALLSTGKIITVNEE